MEFFDRDLLYNSRVMDGALSPFVSDKVRKRLLQIDFKTDSGTDMHVSTVAYQPHSMTDKVLLDELRKYYAGRGYTVTCISEADESGLPCAILYSVPDYWKEITRGRR